MHSHMLRGQMLQISNLRFLLEPLDIGYIILYWHSEFYPVQSNKLYMFCLSSQDGNTPLGLAEKDSHYNEHSRILKDALVR